MPVPIILSPSLRLLPRNIHKASKHGLYIPRRQLFNQFLNKDKQPPEPSEGSGKDDQPPQQLEGENGTENGDEEPLARPDTKVYNNEHFWKANLGSNNSFILYYRTRLAKPFTVSRGWLRDACTCEKCVNPSSGQKNYASADVPLKLDISHLAVTEEGELLVHWQNDFHTRDIHVSKYPRSLWDRLEAVGTNTIPEPRIWNRQTMTETSPYYSYQSFMTDGPEYRQAMTALGELGLVFLRDIPSDEETVKDIASRLGLIQDTFYGTTWDVISKPNAENVAYTNSYLGLHQDLLYMSNVPRIQILHCLENTCEGGESIFSDSYRAVHKFRRIYPSGEAPLVERKVVYHYNKGGNIYRSERPVLSDLGSSKIGVYWSPPFQSPVQADELTSDGMNLYKRWHKSARRIKMFLEEDEAVYEYKMKPGECVIFDNRRVLHGRRAFDTSSGKRWLKGTYVENDSFNSRLRSLRLKPSEILAETPSEAS
ncbi:Clavaminate synthase-like protein [Xylaria curta]|nr:Clavaminate synthase-like protein [Xylaria curta]